MQQMRRRVVFHSQAASIEIDGCLDQLPDLELPGDNLGGMADDSAPVLRVDDSSGDEVATQLPGIRDLAAGFSVKWSDVKDHVSPLSRFKRLDGLAVDKQSLNPCSER